MMYADSIIGLRTVSCSSVLNCTELWYKVLMVSWRALVRCRLTVAKRMAKSTVTNTVICDPPTFKLRYTSVIALSTLVSGTFYSYSLRLWNYTIPKTKCTNGNSTIQCVHKKTNNYFLAQRHQTADHHHLLPAGLRVAQPRRYCFYSVVEKQVFRPTRTTRCPDKREIWHEKADRRSAPPCQISRLSGQKCGNTAPKTVKISNFGHKFAHQGSLVWTIFTKFSDFIRIYR